MRIGQATLFTTALFCGCFSFGTLTHAHASYIDMGTAGYMFQLAISGIFGLLYTARKVWRRRPPDKPVDREKTDPPK